MPSVNVTRKNFAAQYRGAAALTINATNTPYFDKVLKVYRPSTGTALVEQTVTGSANGGTIGGAVTTFYPGFCYRFVVSRFDGSWNLPDFILIDSIPYGDTTPTDQIYWGQIGNSIDTPGGSDTANPVYVDAAYQQLGSPSRITVSNYGRPGKTLAWINANVISTIIADLRAVKNAGTKKKAVYTLHGGENDFTSQASDENHDPDYIYGQLTSICSQLKAEATSSFAVEIVLVPCVKRTPGGTTPSNFNALRTAYNDRLRSNYTSFANGFVEPNNQLSVWGDGYDTNRTYCSDGVHPTTEGARIMGVETAQTLAPFFGISAINPAYVRNIGYTPPTTPTLTALDVAGPGTIAEGASGTYTAVATYSDGSTVNVTSQTTFTATEGTFSGATLTIAANAAVGDSRTIALTASFGNKTTTKSVAVTDASDMSGTYTYAAAAGSPATTGVSQPSAGIFQQERDDDGYFGVGTVTKRVGRQASNNDYVNSLEFKILHKARTHVAGISDSNSAQASLPLQFYPETSGRVRIFSDKGTLADYTGFVEGDLFVIDIYKNRIECLHNGTIKATYSRDAGDTREFFGVVIFGAAKGDPADAIQVRERGVNLVDRNS